VLSILAGLDKATYGGVVIDGTQVDEPGAERAIVFQSPCLLPWLTARQNVELGVVQGTVKKSGREIGATANHYLHVVGAADVADQLPQQISFVVPATSLAMVGANFRH
jgi:ABC-type nitrate/sulfonate/bicarbonate transport system ATPase subunit